MRTMNEILEVVKHPTSFLKSDVYKSAFIEIYSFVPLDKLPETFTKHLTDEQRKDWNPNYEEDIKHIDEDIKEELSYLRAMIGENLYREAAARTPRLFALLWIKGIDVDSLDARLLNILATHESNRDFKRKLLQLYIKIEKKYIL